MDQLIQALLTSQSNQAQQSQPAGTLNFNQSLASLGAVPPVQIPNPVREAYPLEQFEGVKSLLFTNLSVLQLCAKPHLDNITETSQTVRIQGVGSIRLWFRKDGSVRVAAYPRKFSREFVHKVISDQLANPDHSIVAEISFRTQNNNSEKLSFLQFQQLTLEQRLAGSRVPHTRSSNQNTNSSSNSEQIKILLLLVTQLVSEVKSLKDQLAAQR